MRFGSQGVGTVRSQEPERVAGAWAAVVSDLAADRKVGLVTKGLEGDEVTEV
jgi:hypothetical protein